MFIPSTFKRPVSSWKALNLRKTLLMASSVRLKPLNCSRLPCVYAQETLTLLLTQKKTCVKNYVFFSSRRRHTKSYGDLEFRRVLFRSGVTTVLCPADSAPEAALIEPLRVHPVGSLVECVSWLRGGDLPRAAPASPDPEPDHSADLEIGRASCRERA